MTLVNSGLKVLNNSYDQQYYFELVPGYQCQLNITDLPIKHETLIQCCFEIGQPSTTLAQHQNRIG